MMAAPPPKLSLDVFPKWLEGLDAFLFDCDGGATETVALLRALGKRVIFVTNNSAKTRDVFVKKLASQGIPAIADEIVTSAWATVKYTKDQGLAGKVYVVGETGMNQELRAEHNDERDIPVPFVVDPEVKAVVVGLDRHLNYYKLACASCCIREIPGCRFISTNPDTAFPRDGSVLPGGGCLMRFVEATVGHPPEVIVGKPSQYLLKMVMDTHNLDPARTCMVGDILSTDIEFGRRGGIKTLLVLSGVTQEHQLSNIQDQLQIPDFYVDSVDDLNKLHVART